MPEHDEPDAPEDDEPAKTAQELADEDEFWEELEARKKRRTSTTPNLRIPKAERWRVEDKVVDEAETK